MNILMIGNGFDLAHGLPTKYVDFLDWAECILLINNHFFNIDYSLLNKSIEDWMNEENIKLPNISELDDFVTEKFFSKKSTKRNKKTIERLHKYISNNFSTETEIGIRRIKEIYTLLLKNSWIGYFLQCDMYQNENWIDFESEISQVVQKIEKDMKSGSGINGMVTNISERFFKPLFWEDMEAKAQELEEEADRSIDEMEKKIGKSLSFEERFVFLEKYRKEHPLNPTKEKITYKDLINILLEDLNRLIRALEIYLTEYISKLDIEMVAPEITTLDIDHVLSFNYTDTYERVYGKNKFVLYDYIHGKANLDNTIEKNNMVLGIDEYLPEDRKDKDIDFIAFKKFYQRIYKESRMHVKKWCREMKKEEEYAKYSREFMLKEQISFELVQKENALSYNWQEVEKLVQSYDKIFEAQHEKHNVYIYGHSLDVTDKDILRDLILNDNVYTTIFYYSEDGNDKSALKEKITNLTKVIGEDELIKRTSGDMRTIYFIMQKNMVEKENIE